MAGTSSREVHVDQPMSELMFGYKLEGGVADILAPRVMVKKSSNRVPYWKRGDLLRPVPDVTADGDDANVVDFATGFVTYSVEAHKLAAKVTDDERENAANEIELETGKTEGIVNLIALNREVRFAAATIANSAIPHANATAKWNAASTAIRKDVQIGVASVRSLTGRSPNTLCIPATVADAMITAAELTDLLKRYTPESLIQGMLPPKLQMMTVVLAGVYYVATKKGQSTETVAAAWGDSVVVAYVASSPTERTPSFAYTFTTKKQVRRWRVESRESDFFEAQDKCDEQVVCADAAYRIDDCL